MLARNCVTERLEAAFPRAVVQPPAAPHDCEDCQAISLHLQSKSWQEISRHFVQQHPDALPLLSPAAYHAYLPAWLLEAALDPDGEVATMVLINLADQPPTQLFTLEQAETVVDLAECVVASYHWGPDDATNGARLAHLRSAWLPSEA